MAEILGNLTSQVLLVPSGGRSSFGSSPAWSKGGEPREAGADTTPEPSVKEQDHSRRKRTTDRSRGQRRRRSNRSPSPKRETSPSPPRYREDRRRPHSPWEHGLQQPCQSFRPLLELVLVVTHLRGLFTLKT